MDVLELMQDFSGSVLRIKKGEEGYSSDDDRQFQDDCDDDTYYLSTAPSDYGSEAGMGDPPAYLNVGVLPTTNEHGETGTGRIVTFPNWVQHRVVSVYNDPSASITAVRKIVRESIAQCNCTADSRLSSASSWSTTVMIATSSIIPGSVTKGWRV
jgi:hypothetical protein